MTAVRVDGVKAGLAKLKGIDPSQSPEWVARALTRMMRAVLDTSRKTQLAGPRPRELDRVTGELAGSLEIDESALPLAVRGGTALSWAPVHEFGRSGKLSFLEPALDMEMPGFTDTAIEEWQGSFDRA